MASDSLDRRVPTKDAVTGIVIAALKKNLEFSRVNRDSSATVLEPVREDAVVFGMGGLDSIGLINLIVDLEADLSDGPGLSVILADEKAMSRSSSPFRTVATLVDFILETAVER